MSDNDALELWRSFGVTGTRDEMLSLFHTFENHPLLIQALAAYDYTNAQRAAAGLPPLAWDEAASQAAFAHSADMRVRGFFSHRNPDGELPFDRLIAVGITYWTVTENILYWDDIGPADAIHLWMESPGHRANILNQHVTHVGIGMHTDGETSWWTQVFYMIR